MPAGAAAWGRAAGAAGSRPHLGSMRAGERCIAPPMHPDPTPAAAPLPPAPAGRRGRWLTLLLIVALAGAAYWLVQRAREPAPPAPPRAGAAGGGSPGGPPAGGVTVGLAPATPGEIPVVIDALGTVSSPLTAALVPQVSGVLTEVLFTEGQSVRKGQVLARIDPRPYEQALAQARGQRLRDQAQLAAAQVTLQRYRRLLEQDSIARQEVDSQAALVQQLQGTIDADLASERAAQLNLEFATIRAPISGVIGLRTVDPGNLVSSGSAAGIATITQMAPIDVVFAIPQDRIQAVRAAQRRGPLPVLALDPARSRTLAQGSFLTLDNQVNPATGTVLAKARFANADGQLFPNQFVNAQLQLGRERGVLVPVTALRTGPQGDYVYVVDAARIAHLRPVTRGIASADRVLIRSGLQPGEEVVTEGGDRVRDGGRVHAAEGAADGAAQPASAASAGAAAVPAGAASAAAVRRRQPRAQAGGA